MFARPSRIEYVTEQQFRDVLLADGYEPDHADLQVKVCAALGAIMLVNGVGYGIEDGPTIVSGGHDHAE